MRSTLTSEVLHRIEDATLEPEPGQKPGITVTGLVERTEKPETSIRKAVKQLEADGFIRRDGAEGRSWRYVAVRKQDEPEEVKDMAETKEKKTGAPSSSRASTTRSSTSPPGGGPTRPHVTVGRSGDSVDGLSPTFGSRRSARAADWRTPQSQQPAVSTSASHVVLDSSS